jgi:hypothetical protein
VDLHTFDGFANCFSGSLLLSHLKKVVKVGKGALMMMQWAHLLDRSCGVVLVAL